MQPLMITSAHDVYRKQAVLTASPLELVVMLYEGLKKNMLLARRAIEKGNPSAAHKHLMKSQAIVAELVTSLDMSVPLSEDLLRAYDYMLDAMIVINMKKDATLFEPVLDMISGLKEAWETVCGELQGGLSLIED